VPPLAFTEAEQAYLAPVLDALSQRAGREEPFTVQFLVDYWQAFVSELEAGYEGGMDAYVNDVTVRDILQHQVIQGAPPRLQLKVSFALLPIDERFRNATQELDRPIRPAPDGSQRGWWWYRAPKGVNVSWRQGT
jgi:hypothetical protein